MSDPTVPIGGGDNQDPDDTLPAAKLSGRRHRLDTGSRGLMLAWSLWLLGSWVISLRLDSTLPAVRWMIFASLFGLMLLWPAFRLSQDCLIEPDNSAYATGKSRTILPKHIFLDWLRLNLIFQSVVWPLQVTARWWVAQTALLDAAVASWTLMVSVIVAWGCAARGGMQRTVAMLLCLLLLLGEPIVVLILNMSRSNIERSAWIMRISPLQTIWELSGSPWGWSAGPWVERVVVVAVAALVGWILLILFIHHGTAARR